MSDDPRIEKVARTLCLHAGHDPEAMATDASSVTFNVDRKDPPHPRWHYYVSDARKFVAVHDALNT
jgi:hypothetical protein